MRMATTPNRVVVRISRLLRAVWHDWRLVFRDFDESRRDRGSQHAFPLLDCSSGLRWLFGGALIQKEEVTG